MRCAMRCVGVTGTTNKPDDGGGNVKILALSEHFWPRFGGTVTYVHKTCEALSRHGISVELLVPGPQPASVTDEMLKGLSYQVHWIDAAYPPTGEPSRATRYAFCRAAEREVLKRCADPETRPNIMHVLFGLFLMEALDTRKFRRLGVSSVTTVHNVPPMECGRTWDGSTLRDQALDRIRLSGVAIKNAARLRRFPYDRYVVPSKPVAQVLSGIVRDAKIEVIGHGIDKQLLALMRPPPSRALKPGDALRIFTAGGWAPHKRQAILPEAIHLLSRRGIDVKWEVAGPSTRVPGYREAVEEMAQRLGVADSLIIDGAVDIKELAAGYDRANLYVQPSTEEGYCLTALDAAAAGLPVIGSPAGAIPEICEISGGRLADSRPAEIADAIASFVENDEWSAGRGRDSHWIRAEMTWDNAAKKLAEVFAKLVALQN